MKISQILKLDTGPLTTDLIHGKKISVLTELVSKGVNIPNGFYFNIESMFKRHKNESSKKIKEAYNSLVNNSNKKVIVRSSMSVENHISHQFPGIFKSINNVSNESELIKAVYECYQSKETDKAFRYADPLKISLKETKVSILVQEQIELSFFGLAEIKRNAFEPNANFLTLEITDGNGELLIKGLETPSAVRLYSEGNYDIITNNKDLELGKINFQELNRELVKIRSSLNYDTIVEFGIDKSNNVYIFQAREHEIKGKNPLRGYIPEKEKTILSEKKSIIFKEEKQLGLKGASMDYFKKNKLFEEDLLLVKHESSLYEIRNLLDNSDFCKRPITIRFSKGDEIGLKRFFASDKESAYNEICKHFPLFKSREQLMIIHPYLDVRHSYELLIDFDYFVLEHIPGLWEANNVLEPDVINYETKNHTAEILKVKEKRQKIVSTPYSTDREFVEPLSFQFFEERFNRFLPFYARLKEDFSDHLPLNFHFVETKSGKIAFLNIRRLNIKRDLFKDSRYVRDGSFFYVRDEEDLEGWDGKTPILLRATSERGEEKKFINLAYHLPKNVDVYVSFGWLSHPAMVLREYDVHIIPAYLNRDIKLIQNDNN